jgi:hypothetical protein
LAATNGSGRLAIIEAILERLAETQERDHEGFTHDHKQLMTWQVLMQETIDKAEAARLQDREDAVRQRQRLNQLNETTDNGLLIGSVRLCSLFQRPNLISPWPGSASRWCCHFCFAWEPSKSTSD